LQDGAGAGAAAVATSCDVDLLDLIGEEEHVNFGLKLSAKLQTMSEPDHIVAFVGALLKDLQPALKSSDYQVRERCHATLGRQPFVSLIDCRCARLVH